MRRLLLFFLGLPAGALAQDTLIGHVMNEYGAPVPYATIRSVKNKKAVTATDVHGNFKIVTGNSDTLVCSHVQFEPQRTATNHTRSVLFILAKRKPEEQTIVVTAYAYLLEPAVPSPPAKAAQVPGPPPGDEPNYEQTFTPVELPAGYPGGPDALRRHLYATLQFPDTAAVAGAFEAVVRVRFTVDRNGRVSQVLFLNSVGEPYESVVRKAMRTMPEWRPAHQNGRWVDSEHELVIPLLVELRRGAHGILRRSR
ncbi:carboxypeptidase-like regulatory domain-containing protein [Flaviaesturariibacter amylovorans]|uniref:TonB C-terminal domain-containing protein n=1 Tax=Flaviaesturariibacter amylovorans TaxID=1084520 RepID=A0ABP8GI66_9BACT